MSMEGAGARGVPSSVRIRGSWNRCLFTTVALLNHHTGVFFHQFAPPLTEAHGLQAGLAGRLFRSRFGGSRPGVPVNHGIAASQSGSVLMDWVTLLRPSHWVKNGFILAPLLFSGKASDPGLILKTGLGAILFSLLSSGVYAINDVVDRRADQAHPDKRRRPVASGAIAPGAALTAGIGLVVVALAGGMVLDSGFATVAAVYLGLNVLYTQWLKQVVLLEVFVLATFFLLRLEAGAILIDVIPTVWLLLCGGLLALFLGFSKRRHELTLLGEDSASHRAVLGEYSPALLDQITTVLLSATVISYIMYTLASDTASVVGSSRLTWSTGFVLYGMFRFLYLVHRREGGSPAETLWGDRPLAATIALWAVYCGWVIYRAAPIPS